MRRRGAGRWGSSTTTATSSRPGSPTFARDLAALLQLPDGGGVTGLLVGRSQAAGDMTRARLAGIVARQPALEGRPVVGNVDGGTAPVMAVRNAAVAAADQWIDPDDGIRYPAGEVHAWERGRNETLCGLALSRSHLTRFPHVAWSDVQPASGRHAEGVQAVCRRCRAATGSRRDERGWTRTDPRP